MKNQFVSGEWSGFYIEEHRQSRGWMHLFLTFDKGEIRGEGTDYVGPWVAQGRYDEQSGDCRWTKKYVGAHNVDYSGKCSENGIQGSWRIIGEGPFHIWPKSHSHFNEMYLRDELEMATESGPSILLESNRARNVI